MSTKTFPQQNQTNPAVTITGYFCYDNENRLLSKTYSTTALTCPLSSPLATYSYDGTNCLGLSPCYNIHHRTSMTDAAGSEAWAYGDITNQGPVVVDQRITNGVTKTATYQSNLDGSLASLTYPSGRVITYALASSGTNTAGRIASAVDSTGPINYATGALYSPAGALSYFTNGASIVSTLYYNNRLQPCRISVKFSGTAPANCTDTATGNVVDFTYCFYPLVNNSCPIPGQGGGGNNGNVTGITNNRDTTRTQSFTYDSLNRIATAKTASTSGTKCWDEQLGYDPWGNLLTIGRISGYSCSNEELLNVGAATNNQISGFCYDADGNLLAQSAPPCPSPTYTYNAENQMTLTAGVTYTYDGDGRRVSKVGSKLYWYGSGGDILAETDASGNTTAEYIFFGGKRIARRDSTNAVNYYFSDHLGTARIVASSSGSVLEDSDFYPFGGERVVTSSSGNHYKFTGKERDTESSLDYFGARHNASSLGRFMSPDPSMDSAKLRIPQSWNRYAYTLDNPLRYIDPDGEEWIQSGNASNPYAWVDDCDEQSVPCYDAVAAVVGDTLRLYGSSNAQDITNIQGNAYGMVDLNDINQQHDAAFDVNTRTDYSYVSLQTGAGFFNLVQNYQANYPDEAPNLYVTEAGSENGADVPGHLTHHDGKQIDLRYVDDDGNPIRDPEAYNQADADRMWDIFRMAHHDGLTQIYVGDDSQWGDYAHRPTNPNADPHFSHFHLSIPNPTPPTRP